MFTSNSSNYLNNHTLNITGSNFTNNTANKNSSAILSTVLNMNLYDCIFSENKFNEDTNVIYINAETFLYNETYFQIDYNDITSNKIQTYLFLNTIDFLNPRGNGSAFVYGCFRPNSSDVTFKNRTGYFKASFPDSDAWLKVPYEGVFPENGTVIFGSDINTESGKTPNVIQNDHTKSKIAIGVAVIGSTAASIAVIAGVWGCCAGPAPTATGSVVGTPLVTGAVNQAKPNCWSRFKDLIRNNHKKILGGGGSVAVGTVSTVLPIKFTQLHIIDDFDFIVDFQGKKNSIC